MFKTRFISGAVLTLLTIGILYLGGYVTGVAVMTFEFGRSVELMRVYKQEKSAMASACLSDDDRVLLLLILPFGEIPSAAHDSVCIIGIGCLCDHISKVHGQRCDGCNLSIFLCFIAAVLPVSGSYLKVRWCFGCDGIYLFLDQ